MFRNMSTSLFTAEEKRQVRWFVMRAYKNEKMAEDRLKDKEYGLEYFIPKHYAVRTYHGVKSKKLVPVIPSLLFVHASHSQITEFKKRYNFLQFAMWEKSTGAEYITVPDDQMDSFIKIASHYEEDTVYYRPEFLVSSMIRSSSGRCLRVSSFATSPRSLSQSSPRHAGRKMVSTPSASSVRLARYFFSSVARPLDRNRFIPASPSGDEVAVISTLSMRNSPV